MIRDWSGSNGAAMLDDMLDEFALGIIQRKSALSLIDQADNVYRTTHGLLKEARRESDSKMSGSPWKRMGTKRKQ